jgi:hypothetical protein
MAEATDEPDPGNPYFADCGTARYYWNDRPGMTDGIKHLFDDDDVDHMKHVTGGNLDLGNYKSTMIWSYKIYTYVANGYMPPGQPWQPDMVKKFACWIKQDCPENPP